MFVIGDIHGSLSTYLWAIEKMEQSGGRLMDCSLQIGDFGFGFNNKFGPIADQVPVMPQHKFFRGNHDDPAACNAHPNCLGDFGYIEEMGLFWLAGGYSIDWARREPGISWWADEELSYEQLTSVYELYAEKKPSIVITHECPTAVKGFAIGPNPMFKKIYTSRTEQALQMMFAEHQPDLWVFGHYHRRDEMEVDGTRFVVLDEMGRGNAKDCIFEIEGLQWPERLTVELQSEEKSN